MKSCCRAFGMLGLALLVAAAAGFAGDDKTKPAWKGDVYPLDTCVVSGQKLGSMGAPVVKDYDGREVRFCCESCVPKFEADKAKYLKKIDDQIIEQQMPHYPLKTCVVMTEDPLTGGQEKPVNLVYRNRLVRFCCDECPKEFEKNPAKFVAALDEAVIKQQKDKYPLTTCPVSGEKLGGMGEPVNYVVGTTLVRFCCADCIKTFEKNPQPVLAKVNEAWKAAHPADHDDHAKPANGKSGDKPADKPQGHG